MNIYIYFKNWLLIIIYIYIYIFFIIEDVLYKFPKVKKKNEIFHNLVQRQNTFFYNNLKGKTNLTLKRINKRVCYLTS